VRPASALEADSSLLLTLANRAMVKVSTDTRTGHPNDNTVLHCIEEPSYSRCSPSLQKPTSYACIFPLLVSHAAVNPWKAVTE
jgi:hypothetical protein